MLAHGDAVTSHGESSTQELPQVEATCLIIPASHLSWHRLQLPKMAASRWKAALNGLLEDRLLDPPEAFHFALEPGFQAGNPQAQWVAACHRQVLQGLLTRLQEAGRTVVRILPEIVPTDTTCAWAHEQDQQPWLSMSGPMGVWSCPLSTETSLQNLRSWLESSPPSEVSSTPNCAALAERHFPDWTWTVEPWPSQWLRSAATAWNLAQFDVRLSAPNRRRASVGQWVELLLKDPAASSMRWALGALVAVQLTGLNLVALQERRTLSGLELEMHELLNKAAPGTGLVLDAPRQLERVWQQTRSGHGTPSGSDPESLLQALDRALSRLPMRVVRLEYQPVRSVVGLSDPTAGWVERINQGLAGSGWKAQAQGSDLLMTWSAQ